MKITDKELNEREEWERCAENAYQVSDKFVLQLIEEYRNLREKSRALVDAMPRCFSCDVPGLASSFGHDIQDQPSRLECDRHADRDVPQGYTPDIDVSYAQTLRNLIET